MDTTVETKESRLSYCEQTIANGKKTFIEVGNALAEIMESQLYKLKGFGSFAEYTEKVWGFKKTYAYQLVNSFKAVESVSAIAENITESQARELSKVAPAQREEVLAKAGPNPTARAIREAAQPKQVIGQVVDQSPALRGIDVEKLNPQTELTPIETELIDALEVAKADIEYLEDCIMGHSCAVDIIGSAKLNFQVLAKKLEKLANQYRSK